MGGCFCVCVCLYVCFYVCDLHAGILREGGRHLSVDQLPLRLPVRHRVRGRQLLHHPGGDEEDEGGEGLRTRVYFGTATAEQHHCRRQDHRVATGFRKRLKNHLFTEFTLNLISLPPYPRHQPPTHPLYVIPSTFDASQAMAFDGCFHDDEIELTPYPGSRSRTMTSDPRESAGVGAHAPGHGGVGVRLHRRKSLRAHVDLLLSHSYMIDSYSRVVFPMSYLLFNVIYWSLYS
ncbi:uncharacterized protein LOC132452251 isoform X1 [Gadus macrocephalus]|uniref:uncharacterized protein LOC132452251 isoform X1 n=2 Tax=Gadus macrocephalus TaxID=80720 RepID=UPI0028CB1BAB|nr:uncharacterized protein LOC132452251 isoform X1 [Gadus macrocephalus]